jgi:hypothetical protein
MIVKGITMIVKGITIGDPFLNIGLGSKLNPLNPPPLLLPSSTAAQVSKLYSVGKKLP